MEWSRRENRNWNSVNFAKKDLVQFMCSDFNHSHQESKKSWFPAKKYGWGWGFPDTWQGWTVLVAWFILFFGGVYLLPCHVSHGIIWVVPYVFFLIAVLVVICWLKGEPPRWRWGNEDDK